ncbi:MAG TPA: hypothetical protein VGG28_10735, partial [Kofleriaceae bacterium]
MRTGLVVAVCVACTHPSVAPPAPRGPETLAFEIREGAIDNYFFRQGPVAAHVVLTSGAAPRVLVVFPAGDEGIGLWFESGESADITASSPVTTAAGSGAFRGITVQLAISQPLIVREAALAGVRTLRDYNTLRSLPAAFASTTEPGPPVIVRRTLLDGTHLELELAGAVRVDDGAIALSPGAVTLTVLSDQPPLTPIETTELLDHVPQGHTRELDGLAFLSYREKLLAGSWRFLTYFGRDTLLTLRLLMPHARPELVEAGLAAVIDRLDPTGDVAHEEDIGDFAAWENHGSASPRFDYKMIDDDMLLAPVLASYAGSADRARLAAFLERRTPRGERYADAIATNLAFVLRVARPYAAAPTPANLVHLHPGVAVGDWRDSAGGLAGGRTPYDVNAALVPAALAAIAQLSALPELADAARGAEANRLAAAWSHAADAFRVELSLDDARRRVAEYSAALGLDADAASAAIGSI